MFEELRFIGWGETSSSLSCWGRILPLCALWFSQPIFLAGDVSFVCLSIGANLGFGPSLVVGCCFLYLTPYR